MTRRILLVLAGLSLIAGIAIPSGAVDDPDIRSLPLQLTPVYVTGAGVGEPSIALSSTDHVYFCGPLGIPGGRTMFVRTKDWTTFQRQTVFDRAGGGDCDIKVGPDDTLYHANLQAVASAVRRSTNEGDTWSDPGTEDAVEQDRQWLATDPTDPSIVYMGYHEWGASAIVMAKSLDGARTFVVHSVVSTDPVLLPDTFRSTIPGPVRVDPTDHNRVFMVWSTSSIAECARSALDCAMRAHHRIVVGRSDDGGLTWQNHVAMDSPAGSVLGQLIPWMALDQAGNIYVAAAGHIPDANNVQTNGMYMASSTDQGVTWSVPAKVNQGAGAAVFPTVIAGMDGVANFAWIESTRPSPDDLAGVWTAHFAQSRNAHAASPAFTEIVGPVIHNGDVCTRGIGCLLGGNRVLLDFIDMQLDSFGYAHVALAATVPSGLKILWWRQDSGPSATSAPCPAAGGPDCVTVRPGPVNP